VFNVVVGKYLKAREHDIYKAIDSVCKRAGLGPAVVAKGKNALQRGETIVAAWGEFADPVAVGLDASRFDQHVSVEALEWEHSVYQALYPGDDELRQALSWQRENYGFVRCGEETFKYKVKGCRMSGDMNTSLGNVLLMCAMMMEYTQWLSLRRCRLINDGDDCVLIVERGDFERVRDTVVAYFLQNFGFTMKVEGYTDVLEKIEFCQSQPVFDGEKWRMVRQPHICLSKDLYSVRPILGELHWNTLRAQIGSCGMALAGDLPVFQAFYSMLGRDCGAKRAKLGPGETGMDHLARGMHAAHKTITPAARASYFAAFDVTPDEQVALEHFYDAINPTYTPKGVAPGFTQEIYKRNLIRTTHTTTSLH